MGSRELPGITDAGCRIPTIPCPALGLHHDGLLFAAAWTEPSEPQVLSACLVIVDIPALSGVGLLALFAFLANTGFFFVGRKTAHSR